MVEDEKGDLVTVFHSILAKWRNHFSQLSNLQVMDKIMETLDDIGIQLFVWLHWKNISCEYLSLFCCLFMVCSAGVSALLQIVFSNSSYDRTVKWEACQIIKEDRLLVHI